MTVSVLAPSNWIQPDTPPVWLLGWSGGSNSEILSYFWSGAKYIIPPNCEYGGKMTRLYFYCPPTEQTYIRFGGVFSGTPEVAIWFDEFASEETLGSSIYYTHELTLESSEPTTANTCSGPGSYADRTVWYATIPSRTIQQFCFRGAGGYPQGNPFEIDLFELSNPVSSAEPLFWRNFKGQRELIL